jgi:hypothetical protein
MSAEILYNITSVKTTYDRRGVKIKSEIGDLYELVENAITNGIITLPGGAHDPVTIEAGSVGVLTLATQELGIDQTALSITESQISDLQSYALATHTHVAADITDFQTEVSANTDVVANIAKVSFPEAPNDGNEYVRKNLGWSIASAGGGTSWGSITGTLSSQTDLQSALDGKSDTGHTHTESDITDLGNYSVVGHTHTESDITDLGNYSVVGHTHVAGDITSGTFADALIAQSNVTQHQAALNITESQISDLGSYLTQVIWGDITGTLSNQTDLKNALDAKAALSHTHVESDITDLGNYQLNLSGLSITKKVTPVNADQVLIQDSADSDNLKVVDAIDIANLAGGGSKEYASFYHTTGGITAINNVEKILVIGNTSVNSNGSVFSLSSNQVTINKTGDFEISYDCYINNQSSSRTEYSTYLKKNGTEVTGTRSATYQRGYDSGMTNSMTIMLSVTSGDYFEIAIIRTDGGSVAGYQDNNGTRFNFKEL